MFNYPTDAELEVKEHDPDIHFPDEDRIVVVLSQHQMQNLGNNRSRYIFMYYERR